MTPEQGRASSLRDSVIDQSAIGESRWPPVAALGLYLALNLGVRVGMPQAGAMHLPWLAPVLEAALLLALLTADPTSPVERRRTRAVAVGLVALLAGAALWATTLLISDLVTGTGVSNSPSDLLATAALVWLGNNLTFGLMYWLMDGGGPISRTVRTTPVDFAFTQHLAPEVAPPGWRPAFLDYVYLSFTNATAFSPTDVMPLTHRAKCAMLVQSTIAVALLGLVVARAVNAFT